MTRRDTNFTPAIVAAVLLHLAALFGGLLAWPRTAPPTASGVTTVSLVAAAPAELSPAAQADVVAPASAETPTAEPAPDVAAPAPAPEPAAPPPAPKAAPAPPTPAPAPVKPAPGKAPKPAAQAAAKPAAAGLDLEALTSSLNRAVKARGGRPAAAKGPDRPETALAAREGQGAATSATGDAAAAVGARLMRMWNPNCSVEGAGDIIVRVRFNLTPDGELSGPPQLIDQGSSAVWQAAADRAVRAVAQAAPYSELPKASYSQWKTFTARFNGEQACR